MRKKRNCGKFLARRELIEPRQRPGRPERLHLARQLHPVDPDAAVHGGRHARPAVLTARRVRRSLARDWVGNAPCHCKPCPELQGEQGSGTDANINSSPAQPAPLSESGRRHTSRRGPFQRCHGKYRRAAEGQPSEHHLLVFRNRKICAVEEPALVSELQCEVVLKDDRAAEHDSAI